MEEQARYFYRDNIDSMRIYDLLRFDGLDMESEAVAADEEDAEGGVGDV